MRPETDGGRHGPFWAGYRPHLIADGSDTMLGIIVIAPDENAMIYPGSEAEIEMELVYHPQMDYSLLQKGKHFTIQEGAKTVGEGIVL